MHTVLCPTSKSPLYNCKRRERGNETNLQVETLPFREKLKDLTSFQNSKNHYVEDIAEVYKIMYSVEKGETVFPLSHNARISEGAFEEPCPG